MTKDLLLDTSVIIDFLRIKNKSESVFYSLVSKDINLLVSILTHAELYSGRSVWEKKVAYEELETIFEGIEVIGLTTKISMEAGKIRAKYDLDLIDSIIASTAIQLDVSLVSLNFKDFSKVEGLELLNIS